MIIGHINNLSELSCYPAVIQKGLAYLRDTDLESLPVGTYEIDGQNLFALVQEMTTQPVDERNPEAHDDYVDIQYLVRGREVIGAAILDERAVIKEDKRPEKDMVLFHTPVNETMIQLEPGSFAIFFPADIHRPGCLSGEACVIKKVVLKIKVVTL